jgi:hypothetical protein
VRPGAGATRVRPAEAYIDHRRELGVAEVTRRLLRASGIAHLLIATGYLREGILGLAATAEAAGASVAEVVRLEGVAEQAIVAGDGSAAGESLELAPFGKVLFSSDAWARRGSTTWARCYGAGPPFEYWVTGWPAATRRIPLGQWLASSFVK